MNCINSEISILRLTAWSKLGRKKAMSNRRWRRLWGSWRRKKVSVAAARQTSLVFRLQYVDHICRISVHLMSHRSVSPQSRVSAADGQVSECSPWLQCQSRRVPVTGCEAGAWPGRGLEHIRGAVLEKRRPDRRKELLHWSLATGVSPHKNMIQAPRSQICSNTHAINSKLVSSKK